jgi:hypothetical protein
MEPMNLPPGYLLPEGRTMLDVLRMDEELLASEGIDARALASADGADESDAESSSK